MAKILAKRWKDYKNSKKSMCLLSVEDRKKIRAEKKQRNGERKNVEMEIKEKKRQFFENIKQKKLEKKAKKNKK